MYACMHACIQHASMCVCLYACVYIHVDARLPVFVPLQIKTYSHHLQHAEMQANVFMKRLLLDASVYVKA